MGQGEYVFRRASSGEARGIYGWHYGEPYSFYDMSRNPEDLDEMLDPDGREKFYSAFRTDGALVGFFSFIDEGGGTLTVGLGMRPDLTDSGLGGEFVGSGLEFACNELGARRFELSVATFNERAIRVYERVGFQATNTFTRSSGSEEFEFLRMTLDDPPHASTPAARRRT